jgi:transcriptional regulator with XRE-family HTH domain
MNEFNECEASPWNHDTVGAIVKSVRTEIGMSLRELARQSGVSVAELSYLEGRQRKIPRSDTLRRISRVLQLDSTKLLKKAHEEMINDYLRKIMRISRNGFTQHEQEAVLSRCFARFDEKLRKEGDYEKCEDKADSQENAHGAARISFTANTRHPVGGVTENG